MYLYIYFRPKLSFHFVQLQCLCRSYIDKWPLMTSAQWVHLQFVGEQKGIGKNKSQEGKGKAGGGAGVDFVFTKKPCLARSPVEETCLRRSQNLLGGRKFFHTLNLQSRDPAIPAHQSPVWAQMSAISTVQTCHGIDLHIVFSVFF